MKVPILGYAKLVAFGVSLAVEREVQDCDQNEEAFDLQSQSVPQRALWRQWGDKAVGLMLLMSLRRR